MRLLRASAAGPLLLVALALVGCGAQAGRGDAERATTTTTTTKATTTTRAADRFAPVGELPRRDTGAITEAGACPPSDLPVPDARARWIVSICPAVVKPLQISQSDLVPAVDQPDWDWPELYAACDAMSGSLDELGTALEQAPAGNEEMVRELTRYRTELDAFADGCLANQPSEDKGPIQALTSHLYATQDTVDRFQIAMAAALRGG